MFYINTKNIALIGLTFFVVSLSACAIFFYKISAQKAFLHDKSVEQATSKSQHDSIQELVKKLENTKAEREVLMSRILPENGVVDFLARIESIQKEQGVTLSTDSLTIEPINATFEKLVITISVYGQYASVLQVLELLEQVPYQSVIRKVSIGREEKNGNAWKGLLELSVTKFKKI